MEAVKNSLEMTKAETGISVVESAQPIKPPTLYDTHIKENFHIFGVGAFIYAVLYTFCMYKNDAGISFFVLVAASLILLWLCLKNLEIPMKKENAFYGISMLLLGISTFCTDDWRIIFFNKTGVFLLTITMLLGALYQTNEWNLGKYIGSILKACTMAVGQITKPFSDGAWYCKNKLDKKNSKYLYIVIGVGLAIPVLVLMFLLLSSADIVFRTAADRVLEGFEYGDIIGMTSMAAAVFLAVYCILAYLCKKEIKEEVKDLRTGEPLIAIPVGALLTLMYLVFSGIQIVYLFLGNMELPAGYTYAQYAREGFFQLLAVSVLNLIFVLAGLYYFKSSKVLKGILTVMSLCTFVMIASSAFRMIIYIQYYYLTFLRILVLWSLLVLFLLFAGVMVYIVKENFHLFRYSMIVVTCLYIALSFSHPDYWIAKVNLASTEENRSDFFKGEPYMDYVYLSGLSADAAPVMLPWIEENGYSFETYYSLSLYDTWLMEDDEKGWCAFSYLERQRRNCKDIGLWDFNVSRFYVDTEVLFQATKGM